MIRPHEHPREALPVLFALTLMALSMLSLAWTEGEAERYPLTPLHQAELP